MKLIVSILKFIDKFNKYLAVTVSILLPAMVFILSFETVSRYFFNKPTIWAYDMAIFMFGYVGLLGGAYVYKLKSHVSVDIVYHQVSERGKAILDAITGLIVILFLVIAILYTWEPAVWAIQRHETTKSLWHPPIGHLKLLIPVATFFLLLQVLANWTRSLYRAITDRDLEE